VLTVSEVAVNDVPDDPDGAVAMTQSPVFTAVKVVVTGRLNFVADVQETATWPACWLCTCIVLPEIAATCPAAAGRPAWPPPAAAPAPAGVDELEMVPEEDPLHAARVSPAASAAAPTTRVRRALETVGEIITKFPFVAGLFAAKCIDRRESRRA
jgi:hypothetical protein